MKQPRRTLYGFGWTRLADGERIPCAPWLVCWLYHHVWRLAFDLVPARWFKATGWRKRVFDTILVGFGWWGYSHRHKARPASFPPFDF